MKYLKSALILILLISATIYAENIHKEITVKSGKKLEVDLDTGGDIVIQGWDKNIVSVDVTFKGESDKDYAIDVDETSAGVSIQSRYEGRRWNHPRSPRFEIHTPKKFDLDLDSKGGTFTINGVEGDLAGTTMGGALDLTNLKGKVHFHTMGGQISLTKSEVDGEVKTNGGKVWLQDVVGNVNGQSMGGAVTYQNVTDRAGRSTGDVVKITTMGGEINVDDAPHGAELSTMGGEITVHSANQFVNAKTMGGNILIEKVDGWVRAETMGGDVDVAMVGNPSEGKRDVYITSKGGDITLTVPDGLSMDVDISIAYTDDYRHGRKSYGIESDYTLKEERSKDWDDRWGSPRRFITATGEINGGKNKIHIETINGDVYLKKSK